MILLYGNNCLETEFAGGVGGEAGGVGPVQRPSQLEVGQWLAEGRVLEVDGSLLPSVNVDHQLRHAEGPLGRGVADGDGVPPLVRERAVVNLESNAVQE